MRLETFKTDRSKKIRKVFIALGATIILVGGIIVYRSYAIYQESKTFNVIRGQVPKFSSSDIEIAYTIDGEKAASFPLGHIYDVEVDCNGTATGEWIESGWYLKIRNATAEKVKCTVNFTKKEITTLADNIFNLAETDTNNLVYDDTSDSNLRYIGADPNNYLCFDSDCTNGKWRVIGVMNDIETESNGTQSLVKIIRADSVGSNKWDDNNVNDWTTATLQTNLNSGDLYTTYIKNYDSLFETITWNLGGASYSDDWTASNLYTLERGVSVYSGHVTTWSGKIGLMYPSDYGYATNGGSTTNRDSCLLTALSSWNSTDPDVSDCKNNDYLYLKSLEWTLTPNSDDSSDVFLVNSTGNVGSGNAPFSFAVRPVGYLTSKTKILSGNGSNETPWIIGA